MFEKQRISLKDIAKAGGVSTITVSRALDPMRSHTIGAATRDRLRKLAEEMNYSSNLAARRFKRGRSETISVVIPQSIFRKPDSIDFSAHGSVLFWEIIEGIIKTAKYWKYDIKLEPFMESDQPDILLNNICSSHADGVIFIGVYEDYSNVMPQLRKNNIPYLLLSTTPSSQPEVQEISFDLTAGLHSAFEYLRQKDRKKFAMIYPYEKPNSPRFRVFRDMLLDADLYNEKLAFQVQSLEALRALVSKIKNKPLFDAVFCHNDTMAFYLIREIRNTTSIKVPLDISVLGYDNNFVYDEMNLSTIALSRVELGAEGVNTLVNMIAGKENFTARKLLNTEFKEGTTC